MATGVNYAGVGRPAWVGRALVAVEAWAGAEQGRFMPWGAVCLVAGAAWYFVLRVEPPWWWGIGAFAWLVVGVFLSGWLPMVRGLLIGGAAVALGFASAQWAASRPAPRELLPAKAVVFTGVVQQLEVLAEGRRLILGQVRLGDESAPLGRGVRVRMKRGDATQVSAGDRVRVRSVLRAPPPPPYPGGWDQQFDAWFGGIAGGGVALDPVQVVERGESGAWFGWLQGARETVAGRAIAALPGAPGAIAATLLTGSARAIPEADRAAFRDSGLAHLLAVAGLHIGIVMGLFLVGVRLGLAAWPYAALHWPTKSIAAVAALAAGAAYLGLTGGHVPILRAFAMACLVALATVVGRRALSLRGLALAAGVLVLASPQEVMGVSFQMSFAAVLALIAGYEAARPAFSRLAGWGRVPAHLAALVLTSLLAGTASAPYGAYHFGHVQLYFIAANLVAVPLTAFWVLPWGVAALLLMPFGLDRLAFAPMGWGLDGIIVVARTVASWPAATLPVPPMPGWGLAAFSLGLAWLCLWRTRMRLAGIVAMVLGLASPLATPLPDLLVSDDARLIALRQADGYHVQAQPGASAFVRQAWESHLGQGAFLPLGPGCTPTVCVVGSALLLRGGTHAADCVGVELVLSAVPARGVCPAAALVDRFSVWRNGAYAVWLRAGGPFVLSDRADRGERPWVTPPPVPGQRRTTQPMAATDPAPPDEEGAQ